MLYTLPKKGELYSNIHHPTVKNVTFWRATRCGFAKRLLKNAKYNSQIVKIWQFLWNPHLVAPESATSDFWRLLTIYGQKNFKNAKIPEVVDFTKISKYSLFACYIWRFSAIFGKTTSGSSPKQDILDRWQKHIWLYSS